MIYTHVLNLGGLGLKSPVDTLRNLMATRIVRKLYILLRGQVAMFQWRGLLSWTPQSTGPVIWKAQ